MSDISDNVAATKSIIEIYKKHPVVIKSTDIIGNHNIKNYFQFKSVTKSYIATLLKETDIEKATGVDKIPPKFVKLLVSIVCTKPCKTILPTYRVNYLTQHVCMGLTEEWKKHLDNSEVLWEGVGAGGVFMRLSKAFHYISYNFVTAKLSSCWFDTTALKYIYYYLVKRKKYM